MLAIAHRLSTIRQAENIVVLDQGRVIEQGAYEALLRQRGRFWQLVQLQSLEGVESTLVDA